MLRLLGATIIAAVFAISSAHAERRVALVFGANDYKVARPLKNAVGDARLIEGVLSRLNFEVYVETDSGLDEMRNSLKAFRERAAGSDVALVYFAGHGAEIAGENRLLPVDADVANLDRLEATTLPLEEVRVTVNATADIGLIFIDACRNDPFGTIAAEGRSAKSLQPAVGEKIQPGLGRVGQAKNLLFAFSAAPGETAADGADGHSPFATALADHLDTQGLEIRSVMTLVQQDVYDRSRGKQLPYVESGLPTIFFAAPSSQAVPERDRLLLAMADLTPDIRSDVERVASDADMPLAPLYAALIGAQPDAMTAEQRNVRLREAADSFVALRQEMRTMASADPQVAALRSRAEQHLALGAFDSARASLIQAAEIDERSRTALQANFNERTLSLAATYSLSGGAANADLSYAQAIADYEKSLALFDEADGAKLTPEQADRRLTILLSLGNLYTKVGNVASAAKSFQTLQRYAKLRIADAPDDPSIRHDLAVAGIKLGTIRIAQGNLVDALRQYETARDMLQEISSKPHPAQAAWKAELARVHDDIGGVLVSQGDLHGADDSYRLGLTLKQELQSASPDDLDLKRDLTVSFDELGDLWRLTGDWDGARSAYEAGLSIRNELAAANPDDDERQRDLSISHDKLGDVLREQGDGAAAIEAYQASKAISEKLARRDPGDAQLRRDVSLSDSKIGNALRDDGDLDGALEAYNSVLATAEALAKLDTGNAEWQRDLSVALEKVADTRLKQKHPREALQKYTASLAIMTKLVASAPGNTEWQRDISITLAEIGAIRLAGRDRRGAKEALSQSLDIRQALAGSDPDNALWQRDLVIAYADYARVADDPKAVLRRALELARSLDEAGRLPENQKNMIAYLEQQLARSGRKSK